MYDTASIWGQGSNTNSGTLVMNDASSIHDNVTNGCVSVMCGPAGRPGAGVNNTGTLTLNDTAAIHHNRVLGPTQNHSPQYPGARGGGVYNEGTLTMTDSSRITDNEAQNGGNGVSGLGGGLYNASGGTLVGVNCAPHTYANVYGNTPDDCYIDAVAGDTNTKRRRAHLITAVVAFIFILTLGASPAAAEPPACSVTNKDSGQTYRRLSRAAKAATSGDHLAVKGTCGDAVVWHDLVIRGVHSGRMGRPVIRHLNVRPVSTLIVRSLTVRGGVEENSCGGGIWNCGDLTLRDVIVRGNRADEGGGICNDRRSTLTLNGTTAIRDNTAEYRSGGVHNLGTLIMNDLSSISGNLSRGDRESRRRGRQQWRLHHERR